MLLQTVVMCCLNFITNDASKIVVFALNHNSSESILNLWWAANNDDNITCNAFCVSIFYLLWKQSQPLNLSVFSSFHLHNIFFVVIFSSNENIGKDCPPLSLLHCPLLHQWLMKRHHVPVGTSSLEIQILCLSCFHQQLPLAPLTLSSLLSVANNKKNHIQCVVCVNKVQMTIGAQWNM